MTEEVIFSFKLYKRKFKRILTAIVIDCQLVTYYIGCVYPYVQSDVTFLPT
jgi:hypothetical protein